jgi:hypothetical protein
VIESSKRAILHTATLDLASVGSGAEIDTAVTVPGVMNRGHEVVVVSAASLESGLVASGFVSDVDEVTVRVSNVSGVGVDPAEQAFNIAVIN